MPLSPSRGKYAPFCTDECILKPRSSGHLGTICPWGALCVRDLKGLWDDDEWKVCLLRKKTSKLKDNIELEGYLYYHESFG